VPQDQSYAVVTPARNEAENLRRLAACLAEQTLRPVEWLIVDNGSTDDTPSVAAELAAAHDWIRVVEARGEATPTRGAPVARAFTAGVEALEAEPAVVVKLDADVSFDPDYFERLVGEFERDERLGIAGGVCFELLDGVWQPTYVTEGRVRGASRAYRWACLQDVLPLEERPWWDGIDGMKANALGWSTRTVHDLGFKHHRQLGRRDAALRRTRFDHGKSAYYVGYRPLYIVLASIYRAWKQPAALAMIAGYFSAALHREPRTEDEGLRRYVRRQQSIRRLPLRVREALGRRAA
jgi:poly-beta-1,6-N-acetyl-D-glucosamine synthase